MVEHPLRIYTEDDPELASTYDELPLWSAPFGLSLLSTVEMRSNVTVLDIGSGTGFPLLELAQRLGRSSRIYGVDPWTQANRRAREKVRVHSISNVIVTEAMGECLPFRDNTFHLLVSNNGINNAKDHEKVLEECGRVARANAQMVLTVNLPETMKEFYYIYAETLSELGLESRIHNMQEHIRDHRHPVRLMRKKIEQVGFKLTGSREHSFKIRFADGTALLHHSFFRLFFLDRWEAVVEKGEVEKTFGRLEQNLNNYAHRYGCIDLTVPFVCFDCRRT